MRGKNLKVLQNRSDEDTPARFVVVLTRAQLGTNSMQVDKGKLDSRPVLNLD